jgi:hypothetical protein
MHCQYIKGHSWQHLRQHAQRPAPAALTLLAGKGTAPPFRWHIHPPACWHMASQMLEISQWCKGCSRASCSCPVAVAAESLPRPAGGKPLVSAHTQYTRLWQELLHPRSLRGNSSHCHGKPIRARPTRAWPPTASLLIHACTSVKATTQVAAPRHCSRRS